MEPLWHFLYRSLIVLISVLFVIIMLHHHHRTSATAVTDEEVQQNFSSLPVMSESSSSYDTMNHQQQNVTGPPSEIIRRILRGADHNLTKVLDSLYPEYRLTAVAISSDHADGSNSTDWPAINQIIFVCLTFLVLIVITLYLMNSWSNRLDRRATIHSKTADNHKQPFTISV